MKTSTVAILAVINLMFAIMESGSWMAIVNAFIAGTITGVLVAVFYIEIAKP